MLHSVYSLIFPFTKSIIMQLSSETTCPVIEYSTDYIHSTYNGITIIMNIEKTMFNATKLCTTMGRQFRSVNRTEGFKMFSSLLRAKHSKTDNPVVSSLLVNNGDAEYSGTYLDKRYLNYMAFKVSPEYAITVGEIMDSINDHNTKWLESQIKSLNGDVTWLQESLWRHSTRVDQINKLYIFEKSPSITDSEGNQIEDAVYAISTCQTRVPKKVVISYMFPAAANIRASLRQAIKSMPDISSVGVCRGFGSADLDIIDEWLSQKNPISRHSELD